MSVFMRRNAFHQAAARRRQNEINNSLKRPATRLAGQCKACWNVRGDRIVTSAIEGNVAVRRPSLKTYRKSSEKMETTTWQRLTNKLKNQYNSSLPNNVRKRRTSIFTPRSVEIVAVPLFFFTIIAAWVIGVVDVLPKVYENFEHILLFQQLFVSLLFTEMMINWFCIRYVDSSIKTIDGLKPALKPVILTDDGHVDERYAEEEHSPFTVDSNGVRTYPYWSRTPCFQCDVIRPPRCHHCVLCNICVLKRDHHCFFAGSCVGWRNQRHFIVFCLWAAISCSYAFAHALYYIYYFLWDRISYADLFVPVTVIRFLFGYASLKITLYIAVTSFLFYFFILSSNFFIEHMELVSSGKTSFEVDRVNKRLEIADYRPFVEKMKGIFGEKFWLNFIIPVHFVYPPLDDPNNWPFVTVHRQQ